MAILGKISGLVGSKSSRKLARKEKRLAKATANIGVQRAERAKSIWTDEAARRKLALNEELARRGMTGGTFAEEQKRQLQTGLDREAAGLDEDILLAQQGADVTKYGYKIQKRFKPLQILDTLGEIGEAAMGGASFLKGLGGTGDGGGGGLSPDETFGYG